MHEDLFKAMAQSVIDGEPEEAERLAHQAIQEGIDPLEAINQGFVFGVNYVGEQFSCGELYLPDLVLAGEAMKYAVAVLEPEMARRGTHRQTPAGWCSARWKAISMISAKPWLGRCFLPAALR
jgi:methanogenic corrinoid protein MtbC1